MPLSRSVLNHGATLLDLHQRAMRCSIGVVDLVGEDETELPTPCSEWTLKQLIEHMTVENNGFAAAADGETEDRSAWTRRPIEQDLGADYARSAERVVAAFAADGVLERQFWLPLIDDAVLFPAPQAVSFHLLDYVVHSWDVSAALGHPIAFDDDLLEVVLDIAGREVPDGPNRRRTKPSFQPPVAAPENASPQDRLLAVLGRSPHWPN